MAEAGGERDDLFGRLRPQRLQGMGGVQAPRHPGGQPVAEQRLVGFAELLVAGQDPEQVPGVGQVAVVVVLTGADDRRGDVVAVARRDLHHQLAAEQLAHKLFEHDIGGEQQLAPIADRGQALDDLAGRLPLRR